MGNWPKSGGPTTNVHYREARRCDEMVSPTYQRKPVMGLTPFTSLAHLTITKLGAAKLAVATTALIVGGGTGLASVSALPAPAQSAASHVLVRLGVEVPDPSAHADHTGEVEQDHHGSGNIFDHQSRHQGSEHYGGREHTSTDANISLYPVCLWNELTNMCNRCTDGTRCPDDPDRFKQFCNECHMEQGS